MTKSYHQTATHRSDPRAQFCPCGSPAARWFNGYWACLSCIQIEEGNAYRTLRQQTAGRQYQESSDPTI